MDVALITKFLRETELVLRPRRALAAWGATRLRYHLVSPIDDLKDKTRLREGSVESERPLILTPEALRDRFEGFGEEAADFTRWLSGEYRDLLRALEYKFRNKDLSARVLSEDSRAVAGRIKEDIEGRPVSDAVLIRCPDGAWSLALMKFTLDEAARAFPAHLRTFEEHGLFDPGAGEARRLKRETESLFAAASSDPGARARLGRFLKEHGLFAGYEDRYLSLFR